MAYFTLLFAFAIGVISGYYIRRHNDNISIAGKKSPYSLRLEYNVNNPNHMFYVIEKDGSTVCLNENTSKYVMYATKSEAVNVLNEYEKLGGYKITKF